MIKNLYDWILRMAEHRLSAPILCLIAFSESIFFPIPPDILLIPLCLGKRKGIFSFFMICSIFSILGGITGYFLGQSIWGSNPDQFSAVAYLFFNFIPGFSEAAFYSIKS